MKLKFGLDNQLVCKMNKKLDELIKEQSEDLFFHSACVFIHLFSHSAALSVIQNQYSLLFHMEHVALMSQQRHGSAVTLL